MTDTTFPLNVTRPYWYTYYVFLAFLLVQISYRPLRFNMEGVLDGYEVEILNTLWLGLLGLESVMLAGVVALQVLKATRPALKMKEL